MITLTERRDIVKEYKVVSLPPVLVTEKKSKVTAAQHVEILINQNAVDGWEYHSMETISEVEKSGCFGVIDQKSRITYYVVIFERDELQ